MYIVTGMDKAGDTRAAPGLARHRALFYRDLDEYASAVASFLLAAGARAGAAFVAVPGDRHAKLWRALTKQAVSAAAQAIAARTTFADMCELGRNPGRIIPMIQALIGNSAGRGIRFVGEPIWPGRSTAEMREATRHEALINAAFDGSPVTVLCPYDVARLPEWVIADARRTHPVLVSRGTNLRSTAFDGSGLVPEDCDEPLPRVPARAFVAHYRSNLRDIRNLIGEHARLAGLAQARAVDLILAVSEVAANTLRHTASGGTISIWPAAGELVCQLDDTGFIADPLAGRRAPDGDHPGGHGLWLVHQVCDLVELRTSERGTSVRMHMRLAPTFSGSG
jgi:anti-sigma regulatory factor (Ser/Thr protein kinase)